MPPHFTPGDCLTCGAARIPGKSAKGLCKRCYERARVKGRLSLEQAKRAAYYQAHKEIIKHRVRAFYLTHREHVLAYHATHQEEANQRRRTYWALHPEWARERNRKRRIRTRGALVAKVSIADIYDRDGGICQICHKPVERSKASLDHILPLVHGGTHEPRNVRVTHLRCNITRKHLGSAQLRLLG